MMSDKKKRNENFRVTKEEHEEIVKLANAMGSSKSEVWRRLLATVRVLYTSNLMLSDVLVRSKETVPIHNILEKEGDVSLSSVMRSIPELIKILEAKEVMDSIRK